MKSCTMCTSFMLQSPKADESMMAMAGLLTYSFLVAFPPQFNRDSGMKNQVSLFCKAGIYSCGTVPDSHRIPF